MYCKHNLLGVGGGGGGREHTVNTIYRGKEVYCKQFITEKGVYCKHNL